MSLSAEQLLHATALALARYGVVDSGRYAPIAAIHSQQYGAYSGKLEVEYTGRSAPAEFEYAVASDGSVTYTCLANGTEIKIAETEGIYTQQ